MPNPGLGLSDQAMRAATPAGLNLDFALGRYSQQHRAFVLDDLAGWSFTRPSVATAETAPGVVQAFAAGTPRITPGKGLLIEDASTNLLLRSQDFAHSDWTKHQGGSGVPPVVNANAATAPDGASTADSVTFDLGDGSSDADQSLLGQTYVSESGATYATSVWMRAETPCLVLLRGAGLGDDQVCSVTTDWKRFSVVEAATSGGAGIQIGLRGGAGGDNAATVLIWGAQAEAGPYATSPITTGAAAATRVEDQVALSADLPESYVISGEVTIPPASSGYPNLADLDGDRIFIIGATGQLGLNLGGGAINTGFGAASFAPGSTARFAVRFQAGAMAAAAGGVLTPLNTITPLTGWRAIAIGRLNSGGGLLGSSLRRLSLVPATLTDAQLAALSE